MSSHIASTQSIATKTKDENDDCPLCLNLFDEADVEHPVPCPSHCHYNFCLNCISNLIASSKDPAGVASDGNVAVKVKQSCPQCRSDLSSVLEATLQKRLKFLSTKMRDMKDSDLNATQLRLKYSHMNLNTNNNSTKSNFDVNNGECGMTKVIDTTLFAGLEYFMTDAEQDFVYKLMTSGDVDQVAQAAQILESISVMSRNGRKPVINRLSLNSGRLETSNNRARRPTSRAEMTTSRALAMTHTIEQQQAEEYAASIRLHRKKYPLPVRMPRCVTFYTDKYDHKYGYGLCVVDDEWDGSISDAFRRVLVNKGIVTHSTNLSGRDGQSNEVVDNMLKTCQSSNNGANHLTIHQPRRRVVVSKVKAQAGLYGIQKGDVITHVNGEAFFGTASDLENMLTSFVQGDTFTIVINAEQSVAECLQMRSSLRI